MNQWNRLALYGKDLIRFDKVPLSLAPGVSIIAIHFKSSKPNHPTRWYNKTFGEGRIVSRILSRWSRVSPSKPGNYSLAFWKELSPPLINYTAHWLYLQNIESDIITHDGSRTQTVIPKHNETWTASQFLWQNVRRAFIKRQKINICTWTTCLDQGGGWPTYSTKNVNPLG